MPAEKNTLLRVVVPIIVGVVAMVLVVAGGVNSAKQRQPTSRAT